MPSDLLKEDLISSQILVASPFWHVIFPRHPVFPFHLLFVVRRDGAQTFTDLAAEELIDLLAVTRVLARRSGEEWGDTFEGYNLFSNNGSVKVGQHVPHFHQHIFLRFSDESESPYAMMNQGKHWHSIEDEEWRDQYSRLKKLLNG